MYLAAHGANELGEPPLVGRVYVLVAFLRNERARRPFRLHFGQTAADGLTLVSRDHAGLLKGL